MHFRNTFSTKNKKKQQFANCLYLLIISFCFTLHLILIWCALCCCISENQLSMIRGPTNKQFIDRDETSFCFRIFFFVIPRYTVVYLFNRILIICLFVPVATIIAVIVNNLACFKHNLTISFTLQIEN